MVLNHFFDDNFENILQDFVFVRLVLNIEHDLIHLEIEIVNYLFDDFVNMTEGLKLN